MHELTRKVKRKYMGNKIIIGIFKTFKNEVQILFRVSLEGRLKQNERKPELTNTNKFLFLIPKKLHCADNSSAQKSFKT